MIIVLRPDATQSQIKHIIERVKKLGLKPMVSSATNKRTTSPKMKPTRVGCLRSIICNQASSSGS